MTKSAAYRAKLVGLDDWDAYLMQESGLPGARANLELVQVAADMGDEDPGNGACDGGLEFLGEPAASVEPCERSLDNPSTR